ncbi:reverse transcriptase domain-containing protein [Tanacetum coccineum]
MDQSRDSPSGQIPDIYLHPVLVKKCDGYQENVQSIIKTCTRACPKDYYPLPNIDCKVEAVMGFKYKIFLDAYKGYHQIQMAKEDEEKTAFYTEQGTYYYTKMPFGLKNAGATYQRLVDSTFQSQIGRNLEAYVDDMLKGPSLSSTRLTQNQTKENKQRVPGWTPRQKMPVSADEETDHVTSIADTTFPERDVPIKNILSRTEASGKLAKYAVEIGTYKISFIPRNAVKGQVLADFLSDAPDGEREDEYFQSPEVSPGIDDTEAWTLYTDGAASSKGSGAGLILTGPSGVEYAYALRLTFASTNNEAEYEALLAGLRIARMMNVLWIEVKVDSKLVASQINGMYEASNGSMIKYLAKARNKLATVPFHHLTKEILVEVLNERSTEVQEVQTIVEEEGDNWMTPIIKYLEEGIVPSDNNEARALLPPR